MQVGILYNLTECDSSVKKERDKGKDPTLRHSMLHLQYAFFKENSKLFPAVALCLQV